jgi:hypothetical protein
MSTPIVNPSARLSTCFLHVAVHVVVPLLLFGFAVFGQTQTPAESPRATKDRLIDQYWWPTKGTPPFNAYAGESACRGCHSEEASSQVHTPMAEASFRIVERIPSSKLDSGTLQSGSYLYRIASDNLGARLVVSSGNQSITANISWIFGAGVHGQTYILESKGNFNESQVSSFATLHGMDLTPGHSQIEVGDLKNALAARGRSDWFTSRQAK